MAPRSTANAYDIEMLRSERDEALADNARLIARVAELEAECESLAANSDAVHRAIGEMTGYPELSTIHAVQAVIDELDSRLATLTPRNCETCKRAAEAMREAAALVCDDWNIAPYTLDSHFGGDTIPIAKRQHLADSIRALPLPSFGADQCAGCAPLKPE